MKTLEQKITELKVANPKLYFGSEEDGYVELSQEEYETTILEWAKNLPPEPKTEEEILIEEQEAAAKKAAAEAKLAALGLTADDLKALGLGGN
jgi:hypothetical protein